MSDVSELLKQRQAEYNNAWKVSSLIFTIKPIALGFIHMVSECPEYVYSWVIIMNKLIRLLANPRHLDSWKDIAGYATLTVKDIEGDTNESIQGK